MWNRVSLLLAYMTVVLTNNIYSVECVFTDCIFIEWDHMDLTHDFFSQYMHKCMAFKD